MIPIHPSSQVSGTWHYGVVAQWWYEFNREGAEIPYLKQLIPSTGQPVLDVGCGAGRVLVALAKAGFDVDGADISRDMLERCAQYARAEGVSPQLNAQATHELALPRRYRTVYTCGTFGIGGRRDNDWQGLRRMYQHLDRAERSCSTCMWHGATRRSGCPGWQKSSESCLSPSCQRGRSSPRMA